VSAVRLNFLRECFELLLEFRILFCGSLFLEGENGLFTDGLQILVHCRPYVYSQLELQDFSMVNEVIPYILYLLELQLGSLRGISRRAADQPQRNEVRFHRVNDTGHLDQELVGSDAHVVLDRTLGLDYHLEGGPALDDVGVGLDVVALDFGRFHLEDNYEVRLVRYRNGRRHRVELIYVEDERLDRLDTDELLPLVTVGGLVAGGRAA